MSEVNISNSFGGSGELSIFTSKIDKTSMDIRSISDFMNNGIRWSTSRLSGGKFSRVQISIGEIEMVREVLSLGKAVIGRGYEYLPDFESLPREILIKLKRGIYKLGESRQVDGNMRPVILNENGVRVKDVTLKRTLSVVDTAEYMRNIAIQYQLQQMNQKLDSVIELQEYHIELDKIHSLVDPFFDARDNIIHAQNESDPERIKSYLDKAKSKLESGLNSVYSDLEVSKDYFLNGNRFNIFSRRKNKSRYIPFIARDLQLLCKYIGVLTQIYAYENNERDAEYAFKKYREYMLGFFTTPLPGKHELPMSLLIHQAFDSEGVSNLNVWKDMTDEMVKMLQNTQTIEGAYIISLEDCENE